MVGQAEIEQAILAKLDPTVRFCADASGMLEAHAGDADAKTRALRMVDHVRREASAFAVRIESSGPFATLEDLELMMVRELNPVLLAKAGTLDLLERLVERGALADV